MGYLCCRRNMHSCDEQSRPQLGLHLLLQLNDTTLQAQYSLLRSLTTQPPAPSFNILLLPLLLLQPLPACLAASMACTCCFSFSANTLPLNNIAHAFKDNYSLLRSFTAPAPAPAPASGKPLLPLDRPVVSIACTCCFSSSFNTLPLLLSGSCWVHTTTRGSL